ncbi:MAG: ATP-binding protein [Aestuariibacter sp.]
MQNNGWQHIAKLNPLNSVFGRIFMWFWLTTLVMIIVTATVVRHYITSDDLQSIPDEELRLLDQTAQKITAYAEQRGPISLRRAMIQIERASRVKPLLMRHSDDRIFHRGPIPPEFESRFRSLKNASSAYGFFAHNHVFFGPKTLQINENTFSLFIGRPLRFPMLQRNRGMLLSIAILVSGGLCFILAWQLTQPLKHLRVATQRMAQGDLQAKVEQAEHRKDEIGQLSRDFNAMSEKVNLLVTGQKRLLADISHELRSPLARLQLAIGIAQEQPSEQTVNAMMARIEKEAQQIDAMLSQVLQLSRLESQTMSPDKHLISVDVLLQPIIEDAQYEASTLDKALEISHEAKGNVLADQQLLSSGIENVVRNAIKYARHRVSISTLTEDAHVQIRIIDDGEGVPEQDLDHLFTAFFRVSTARSRDSGGAGLGLAIAKQAINVHNGSITAKNDLQGGLIVEICLPCA